jgi:predicted AlkP superfamily phosphohydrolase/phosphomutase
MTRPVFTIVLDACDRDLITQWAGEGHLPAFRKLLDTSVSGNVENARGLEAGSALPNFYYGSWPGKHGQYDGIRVFDPQTYESRVYDEGELSRKPFWSLLAEAGKRVFLFDAPYIPVPRHPKVKAIMNWGAHTPSPGEANISIVTNPPELADEITARFGRDPLGGFMCDHYRPRKVNDMIWFRDALIQRVRTRTEMIKYFAEREPWDLFLSVFSECHCIGHHAWHLHDPSAEEHDPEAYRQIGDPVLSVYKAVDEALGELLALWEDRADVIVYLSHGMEHGYSGTRLLDRILARLEHGGADPQGFRARHSLRSAGHRLWKVSPKPVKRIMNPLRKYTRKKIYNSGFQPNRESRRFFEVYANDRSGGIRVNLAGRESHGIVQPGAEYDAVCDELIARLREVVNAETGDPLVAEVVKMRDFYSGERLERLPDITVTWNRSRPIQKVASPAIGELWHQHPNIRSGDHKPHGMVFYKSRGLVTHLNNAIDVIDITKTISQMVGVSHPYLEGQPIAEFLSHPSKDSEGLAFAQSSPETQ